MLTPELPGIDDAEGDAVPDGLPGVIDAHVHVFPRRLFAAIWRWFDANAWPIRYRLSTAGVLKFLLARGVRHVVALQYAHRPGIARRLNRFLAEKCRQFPGRVTGMATVFPGEPGAAEILEEAFGLGLGGVKLHAHVQCFDMNSAAMEAVYDRCASAGRPIVMHVGREPKSPAYACDPHALCRADKLERVLKAHPRLKVCVPHLGLDELASYRRLIADYDNLWLDTTMALAGYFPLAAAVDLAGYRAERIMYGSDFPNIPYAWDRELKRLQAAGLAPAALEQVLVRSAVEFFRLPAA
jgi:hypothetical protein